MPLLLIASLGSSPSSFAEALKISSPSAEKESCGASWAAPHPVPPPLLSTKSWHSSVFPVLRLSPPPLGELGYQRAPRTSSPPASQASITQKDPFPPTPRASKALTEGGTANTSSAPLTSSPCWHGLTPPTPQLPPTHTSMCSPAAHPPGASVPLPRRGWRAAAGGAGAGREAEGGQRKGKARL